jgi:hypothetical protein
MTAREISKKATKVFELTKLSEMRSVSAGRELFSIRRTSWFRVSFSFQKLLFPLVLRFFSRLFCDVLLIFIFSAQKRLRLTTWLALIHTSVTSFSLIKSRRRRFFPF